MYRGIDAKSVAGKQIKTGDFVTTDFDDALGYTDSPSKVVSKEVRLKDLIEEYPDEIDITNPLKPVSYELIYNPTGKINKITKSQLEDIWKQAQGKLPKNKNKIMIIPIIQPKTPIIAENTVIIRARNMRANIQTMIFSNIHSLYNTFNLSQ